MSPRNWRRVFAGDSSLAIIQPTAAARERAATASSLDYRVLCGRLAGWLVLSGVVISVPSALLSEPGSPPTDFILTALGLVTGVALLRAPWERSGPRVLHGVAAVATLETILAIAVFDSLYAYFYPLIMVYVAFVFTSRREVLFHFLIIAAALFVPLVYGPSNDDRSNLFWASFVLPVVATSGLMVTVLREQLDRNARDVRELAGEASATTAAILRSLARPPTWVARAAPERPPPPGPQG